jgi:hypothetical protein
MNLSVVVEFEVPDIEFIRIELGLVCTWFGGTALIIV